MSGALSAETTALAKEAANHLALKGEHKRANDVRRLIKSHSVLRAQVQVLQRELIEAGR